MLKCTHTLCQLALITPLINGFLTAVKAMLGESALGVQDTGVEPQTNSTDPGAEQWVELRQSLARQSQAGLACLICVPLLGMR